MSKSSSVHPAPPITPGGMDEAKAFWSQKTPRVEERFFALRDGELEAAQATPSENLGTADGWFVCPEPDEPDEADAAQDLGKLLAVGFKALTAS